jgi:ribokinase
MYSKQIAVIGSSNTDMVVRTARLPKPGETLLGGKFFMNPGGKGANQAVAAARLGGNVIFIARTGNDIFGREARELFQKEGIDVSRIYTDETNPSGVALINVDENGENCIAVAPGANDKLSVDDLKNAREDITRSAIILIQLEIPLESVIWAVKAGQNAGCKVVLNPAPARLLPEEIFQHLFLITPNETEAEILTGIKVTDEQSAESASKNFVSKGVSNVVITLGSKGSYIFNGKTGRIIPAPKVKAVDTTAAGDIFNGALCVALAEGMIMEAAVEFANKAAAISVTRMGAQASAPYLEEVG